VRYTNKNRITSDNELVYNYKSKAKSKSINNIKNSENKKCNFKETKSLLSEYNNSDEEDEF
jgi:hypothetical protein